MAHKDNDVSKGFFVPDADPTTTTDSLNRNTDGDARDDGVEDANKNGRIDEGEPEPNTPEMFCETDMECGAGEYCKVPVCSKKPEGAVETSGCGCGIGGTGDAGFAAGLVALGLIFANRRRRTG